MRKRWQPRALEQASVLGLLLLLSMGLLLRRRLQLLLGLGLLGLGQTQARPWRNPRSQTLPLRSPWPPQAPGLLRQHWHRRRSSLSSVTAPTPTTPNPAACLAACFKVRGA